MENNLYFSSAYKMENGKWKILSDREKVMDKNQMIYFLDFIKDNRSDAKLEIIPEPDIGVSELSVECDGEKYLFTLAEYSEDGYLLTRTKADFSGESKLVNFMGEPYPASAVTTDFDFIKGVFIEFLETGNVSYESMSV